MSEELKTSLKIHRAIQFDASGTEAERIGVTRKSINAIEMEPYGAIDHTWPQIGACITRPASSNSLLYLTSIEQELQRLHHIS